MKTNTSKKIVSYISENGPQKPDTFAHYLAISPQAVHTQLRKLIASGAIVRFGKPPHTHYGLPDVRPSFPKQDVEIENIIEHHFSYLDPVGGLTKGTFTQGVWLSSPCKNE